MQKYLVISPRSVFGILLSWLGLTTILLGLVHITSWWPLKVLLFLCLVLLPGAALLRLMCVGI